MRTNGHNEEGQVMATVSRNLHEQPHLDVPKREAKELLESWRKREPEALERIRGRHPKFRDCDNDAVAAAAFKLSDAQLVRRGGCIVTLAASLMPSAIPR